MTIKKCTFDMDAASQLDQIPSASNAEQETNQDTSQHSGRFQIVNITKQHADPDLLIAWRSMLGRSTGPETLYQTPEFFRFALEGPSENAKSQVLYAVRRNCDGAYVGFVPVRKCNLTLKFDIGPLKLVHRKLVGLQLMGSVPLLDENEPGLVAFVLPQLLAIHADCRLLLMQAVPAAVVPALEAIPGLSAYVPEGLRDCHTVPLPENFAEYLKKFSAKKRYNLTRQIRLLEEQAGKLEVCLIEEVAAVPKMIEAMRDVLTTEQFNEFAKHTSLERLAKHGILHSYVIRCGSENVAVVYGTRSSLVWHVYKIAALAKYKAFSIGTSAMHVALQDVMTNFSFSDVDFGYGVPNQEFRATHVLKERGEVLLCRSRSMTAMLLALHSRYQRAMQSLIARVKERQRRFKQRRQAAPGPAS